MPRVIFGVLFILISLVSGFFVVHEVEAKSKVRLSKKYIPPGNPGGATFYADEDFVDSYKLYEKRKELLKKKKLQDQANININKENLAKKLKEKKIANIDNELSDVAVCIIDDEGDAMINQHGINIARLKGAVLIDQAQYEGEQHESEQQGEKKVATIREKKISPINVAIKNTSLKKRTCSHDSITDLSNASTNTQYSLNGSDSFGSIADAVE